MAYDHLREEQGRVSGTREYLKILHLAAMEGETLVEDALRTLLDLGEAIDRDRIERMLEKPGRAVADVAVDAVDLERYDRLLTEEAA
jgi:hypothetical protein